jgi:hypothetical protein
MAEREQELIKRLQAHRPEPPPAPPNAWALLRRRLAPAAAAPAPKAQSLFWGLGGGLALASALWMLTLIPPAPAEDPAALDAFVIEAGRALFEGSRSQTGEAYFELLEGLS